MAHVKYTPADQDYLYYLPLLNHSDILTLHCFELGFGKISHYISHKG